MRFGGRVMVDARVAQREQVGDARVVGLEAAHERRELRGCKGAPHGLQCADQRRKNRGGDGEAH